MQVKTAALAESAKQKSAQYKVFYKKKSKKERKGRKKERRCGRKKGKRIHGQKKSKVKTRKKRMGKYVRCRVSSVFLENKPKNKGGGES